MCRCAGVPVCRCADWLAAGGCGAGNSGRPGRVCHPVVEYRPGTRCEMAAESDTGLRTRPELFVAYAESDSEWVHGFLLPELGLDRQSVLTPQDFRPGAAVVEELERAVVTARLTVLVLSRAFAASQWSVFAELLASHDSLRRNSDRLVPVLLGQYRTAPPSGLPGTAGLHREVAVGERGRPPAGAASAGPTPGGTAGLPLPRAGRLWPRGSRAVLRARSGERRHQPPDPAAQLPACRLVPPAPASPRCYRPAYCPG